MEIYANSLWSHGMPSAESGPWKVAVADSVIESIEKVSNIPDLATVHELLVPGFIDCHDHIGMDVGDEKAQATQPIPLMLLRGTRNLRTMIRAGVTTMRDCGEHPDAEGAWMEALRNGWIEGPKIVRSVSIVARTGGHAWYLGKQTDGPEALRARVRENLRDGASFIKVMATGGVGTVGSDTSLAEYSLPELQALVDEAHRLGMKVAAHGHGGSGVDDAIEAGVDTIEHGTLLTDEQLVAMARSGITLILTNAVFEEFVTSTEVPVVTREFMPRIVSSAGRVTSRAKELGVTVALGSDCVHGGIAREIDILCKNGYSLSEALSAATFFGAEAIGDSTIGQLRAGFKADILALDQNPFEGSAEFPAPNAVMMDGKWLASR